MYLGLDRQYDHLEHHNFVFSRDPGEEFHAIYEEGRPAPDPTAYLCAPARTESAVAPAGGEALYVLVHTPYLRSGQDWTKMYPIYRKTIFDKLARTAGLKDLEAHIRVERYLTPQDIHERYGVLNGAMADCRAALSRRITVRMCGACILQAAQRIPGQACQWC